jgi:hypothetical protein
MLLPSNQLSTLATALLLFSNGALVKAALYDNVIETKYGPVQGYRAFTSEPKLQPNKLEKHRRVERHSFCSNYRGVTITGKHHSL